MEQVNIYESINKKIKELNLKDSDNKYPECDMLKDADEVKEIKLNQDKLSRKELAKKFNVSYWTICDIFQNKSFREV